MSFLLSPVKDEEYVKLKEAFISDNYGGSIMEINKVTLIAPVGILLWSILQSRLGFFNHYTTLLYIIDFIINGLTILFATTVYSKNPTTLILLLLLPTIIIYTNYNYRIKERKMLIKKDEDKIKDISPKKPFITHYRGSMMIITCICILAVDFKVFPRRFSKTETLGTSLMDLGVGSFIFSSGVVSNMKNRDAKFFKRMKKSMTHSIPLILLGLIRLYTVKKLNYIEHVTEYGKDWNFFFTMAVIPPFVTIFQTIFNMIPSYCIIGYIVSLIQELLLQNTRLIYWGTFAERTGFFSNNKEGLISIPGYLAIYLVGQGIGMIILKRDEEEVVNEDEENDQWVASMLGYKDELKVDNNKSNTNNHNNNINTNSNNTWKELFKWTVIWFGIYYISTGSIGPKLVESRRFANMAYFTWVCSFNTAQLLLFCTIEKIFFDDIYKPKSKHAEREKIEKATSKILSSFNKNGLLIFLLANLLTGLVNLTIKTIKMNDLQAMGILICYTSVITCFAVFLNVYKISVKF